MRYLDLIIFMYRKILVETQGKEIKIGQPVEDSMDKKPSLKEVQKEKGNRVKSKETSPYKSSEPRKDGSSKKRKSLILG